MSEYPKWLNELYIRKVERTKVFFRNNGVCRADYIDFDVRHGGGQIIRRLDEKEVWEILCNISEIPFDFTMFQRTLMLLPLPRHMVDGSSDILKELITKLMHLDMVSQFQNEVVDVFAAYIKMSE